MLKCSHCKRVNTRLVPQTDSKGNTTSPGSGFCEGCGYYLGGRLCLEKECSRVNRLDAVRCRYCGKSKLSNGTGYTSLNFLAPVLGFIIFGGGGVALWYSGIVSSLYQTAVIALTPSLLYLMQLFFVGMTLIFLGVIFYPVLPEPAQKFLRGISKILQHLLAIPYRALMSRLAPKKR